MLKAISLWQPWAHFMAIGQKTMETRSWSTTHRGELAICASVRKLDRRGRHLLDTRIDEKDLSYGCVIAVVNLNTWFPTDYMGDLVLAHKNELHLGDYTAGRFAWLTGNLRRLKDPIPVKGRQGLFNLPDDIEAKVRLQLARGESNPCHPTPRAVDRGAIGGT